MDNIEGYYTEPSIEKYHKRIRTMPHSMIIAGVQCHECMGTDERCENCSIAHNEYVTALWGHRGIRKSNLEVAEAVKGR